MYTGLNVMCPLFLSDFNGTWSSLTDFQKNTWISNFMKICPVGGKLFHEAGHMDMAMLTIISHKFANTPKNWSLESKHIHLISYMSSIMETVKWKIGFKCAVSKCYSLKNYFSTKFHNNLNFLFLLMSLKCTGK